MHIELLHGSPGSYWDYSIGGAGLHHIGVWVDDVTRANQDLVRQGWVVELAGASPRKATGASRTRARPAGSCSSRSPGRAGPRSASSGGTPGEACSSRRFREAMASFPSGATIVTTSDAAGAGGGSPRARSARCRWTRRWCSPAWPAAPSAFRRSPRRHRWNIHVLQHRHADLAMRFATRGADKFDGAGFLPDAHGLPLLADVSVSLRCAAHSKVDGGDHLVLMGQVEEVGHRRARCRSSTSAASFTRWRPRRQGGRPGRPAHPAPGSDRARPRLDVNLARRQLSAERQGHHRYRRGERNGPFDR